MDWNDVLDPTTVPGFIASILSGSLLIGLWFLWRSVKGRLERVLGQTENSHEHTEYPNLRDEVTAIRLIAEETAKISQETATAVDSLASTVSDDRRATRTETEGVRADVRALGQRVDLHIATSTAAQRAAAPPPDPT
jgi:hypothetical protein